MSTQDELREQLKLRKQAKQTGMSGKAAVKSVKEAPSKPAATARAPLATVHANTAARSTSRLSVSKAQAPRVQAVTGPAKRSSLSGRPVGPTIAVAAPPAAATTAADASLEPAEDIIATTVLGVLTGKCDSTALVHLYPGVKNLAEYWTSLANKAIAKGEYKEATDLLEEGLRTVTAASEREKIIAVIVATFRQVVTATAPAAPAPSAAPGGASAPAHHEADDDMEFGKHSIPATQHAADTAHEALMQSASDKLHQIRQSLAPSSFVRKVQAAAPPAVPSAAPSAAPLPAGASGIAHPPKPVANVVRPPTLPARAPPGPSVLGRVASAPAAVPATSSSDAVTTCAVAPTPPRIEPGRVSRMRDMWEQRASGASKSTVPVPTRTAPVEPMSAPAAVAPVAAAAPVPAPVAAPIPAPALAQEGNATADRAVMDKAMEVDSEAVAAAMKRKRHNLLTPSKNMFSPKRPNLGSASRVRTPGHARTCEKPPLPMPLRFETVDEQAGADTSGTSVATPTGLELFGDDDDDAGDIVVGDGSPVCVNLGSAARVPTVKAPLGSAARVAVAPTPRRRAAAAPAPMPSVLPSPAKAEASVQGSVVVLESVAAGARTARDFGSDFFLSPVRRSARVRNNTSSKKAPTPAAPAESPSEDISGLLAAASYCYRPNPLVDALRPPPDATPFVPVPTMPYEQAVERAMEEDVSRRLAFGGF